MNTLFPGERIFDRHNAKDMRELCGDGQSVHAGGELRLLSAMPPPHGSSLAAMARPLSEVIECYPESEWQARIEEQARRMMRVSDYCDFPAYDQNGLPTCWANGPCQSFSTTRRIQGLPYVQISACSVAVPISGGHRGGWEGDAFEYLTKYGGVDVALWPNNATTNKSNDPAVQENRKQHLGLEMLSLNTKAEWVTACLETLAGGFAYNWMSHVMMSSDVVWVDGTVAFRPRNSWSNSWGAKNSKGFGGFNVWRQFPDSGIVLRQVKQSLK